MVRLNHLGITPEEAREVVRALSDTHGLAPEEAQQVAWYWEKRSIPSETLTGNQVGDACARLPPPGAGAVLVSFQEEWDLLVAMHEGYFPVVKRTSFLRPSNPPRGAGSGGGGRPDGESKEKQVDKAITYLSKTNPLLTPEWASWKSARRDPKLGGRWAVNAYLPGKGRFVGAMIVSENSEEVFETCGSLLTASTSLFTARVTQSSCSTLNRSSSSR